MQLKHKLFLALALLTTVPLLVLQFGVVERMRAELTARTETEMHGTLDKMATELALILESQKSIAKGLARVPAVRRFAASVTADADTKQATGIYQQRAEELELFFLDYQRAVPTIQALRFINPDGKTLVKVKEGKPIEPERLMDESGRLFVADQSNKRFFRYAMQGAQQDVVMSDFELGQVTFDTDFCPAMVRYSVQVKDEVDQLDGLLVVNIWGSQLDSTIETSMGGFPAKPYIVELNPGSPRDGIYLYHPNTRQRFADQLNSIFRLSNELTAAEWQGIQQAAAMGSLFTDDGRMLFYRKISPFDTRDTQWLLMVEADSDVVFAPIREMRKSIWYLLGVLLLVSLLVAGWAATRLARPAHDLAEIITRYADGDSKVRYKDQGSDEIGLAGRAFNYLTTSLERAKRERDKAEHAVRQSERLASVGQLAAGIGHEINNPLLNIMSLASLIEDSVKDKDPEVLSDIQLLKKEGKRCAAIVQGILNFARENPPTFREFDMAVLIDETLALLQHRIESAQIRMQSSVPATLMMEGDPNLLQQVLVNVLLNAIQASPAGTEISLLAEYREAQVRIEIRDKGAGIEQQDLSKIFDPFFTTKAEGEGTGLGLSVSYGIIKHHGGSIKLENCEDGGVRVLICLSTKRMQQDKEILPEVVNAV